MNTARNKLITEIDALIEVRPKLNLYEIFGPRVAKINYKALDEKFSKAVEKSYDEWPMDLGGMIDSYNLCGMKDRVFHFCSCKLRFGDDIATALANAAAYDKKLYKDVRQLLESV